jgi:hypothetical protein
MVLADKTVRISAGGRADIRAWIETAAKKAGK